MSTAILGTDSLREQPSQRPFDWNRLSTSFEQANFETIQSDVETNQVSLKEMNTLLGVLVGYDWGYNYKSNFPMTLLSTLLQKGANPNTHARIISILYRRVLNNSELNHSVLIEATIFGRAEIVESLLSHHADPDLVDSLGHTPLMYAAEKINIRRNFVYGDIIDSSSFDSTSFECSTFIVQKLLEAGANPNVQDRDQYTALMVAAKKGNINVVNELLAAGANPTLKDWEGHSALIYAQSGGNQQIIDILEKAIENCNSKNREALIAIRP